MDDLSSAADRRRSAGDGPRATLQAMVEVREIEAREADEWDAIVSQLPNAHLLQSRGWGELRASQGWAVTRLLAVAGERPLGAAQVLEARRRGGTVTYVPRGPACAPGDEAWQALLTALHERYRRRCVALRIEPHWPDAPAGHRAMIAAGLRPVQAVQPPSTVRLPLTEGAEALLAAMKPKWRYNIRLAERNGVVVEEVGQESLTEFEALLAATAQRQGFPSRPSGYHAAAYQSLRPAAALYAARYEGRVLAMIMVARFAGTTTYLYGASREEHRALMPNHALQWRAIKDAINAGDSWYDLWGIPDAVGQEAISGGDPHAVTPAEGGLWGVWRFKGGFGGEVWRAIGAWDDVYAPVRWWLGARLRPRLTQQIGRHR